MKKLFLLCILTLHATISLSQIAQNNFYLNDKIRFERLAIENGLSNNVAFGMVQDQKGFMWFATLEALIKYDGYTLTRYQNDPQDTNSLGDNIVMSVYEDHTGLIWVGTAGGGGVNSFDPQTSKWKRYPHDPKNPNSMGKGSIEGILEDRIGNLWFGSTHGLTRFNPIKNKFTVFENKPNDKYSLSNNWVYSIVEDNAGLIWIGTNYGVNYFDPKKELFYLVEEILTGPNLPELNMVHHIYKDKKGLLWLSMFGNGLFVLDPNSKKSVAHFVHDVTNSNSIGSNVLFAVTEDFIGNYWVSTDKGLYQFNPQTNVFNLYENKSYLPKTQTTGHIIKTDQSGLVWVGTVGRGIIYFSPQQRKFRRYLNDESSLMFGLGSNRIKSLFKSDKGQLFVATNQNLLKFNSSKDQFESVFQLKPIKNENETLNLTAACEEMPGIYLLGTQQKGIIRYDAFTRKATLLQNSPMDSTSLANNWVNVLYKDKSDKIWVGTEGGRLQWYNSLTKQFINYNYLSPKEGAQQNEGIRFIYEDSKGDLWIGIQAYHMSLGGNGVYRINVKTGENKHYKHQVDVSGSISNNSVTCIFEDLEGIFWLGTYGGGLNKLDAVTGKTIVYTKENGLLSNTIQGLVGDKEGNLWIKSNEGITRFNSKTLQTKHFGGENGLASSPLGVESDDLSKYLSIESNEGTIFFGSNNGANGLIAFDPSSIQENKFKPGIAITQFKVFGKNYPITGKEITLNYNQNFFDFEFSALSYLSSAKNQYAYQLERVDNDWVNNGTRRVAHYTKVPPGKYTFKVKGSNNDGVWNEQITTLNIIIKPPWWLTWWAYTLYSILIIGGIWAFIHYRSRNLLMQKSDLEKQVLARTAEVVHQKEELQITLEDLRSTQAQLIQSEKMASLGELTAGIAHEIQNPLNFVNNFSEVSSELVEEASDELNKGSLEETKVILSDLKGNLDKIRHHGQRASSIVKGMLEHSRTNSGKKELIDINVLADEYLRLAYHGLRAKDRNFHADFKTDLDLNLPMMSVVPQDIGRALLNLINNAFQAVGSEGIKNPTVTLSTSKVTSHPESIGSKESVQITVSDNGPGIPAAIKDKIFQPFFTTKPTGKGTGLGLSLTYDIVKAHSGEIKVESEAGKGTNFIIEIPIFKE